MTNLEGRVTLVTGSARGIGYAIAEALARAKARVIISDINKDDVDTAVQSLKDQGYDVLGIPCNVTSEESVSQAVEQIKNEAGPVEILVNNAGITRDMLFMRMDKEKWDSVLTVNLTGAYLTSKAVIRDMAKSHFGRIINISSVVGLIGNAGQANYSASKAGLLGLTKSLAKEFGQRNVTVNAVAPGFIETKMTHVLSDDVKNSFLQNIPMKKMGTPEDVANVVLFLASELASYITGQVINVDGGMVM
ncbi:MAG TPA: 3-oxoacyl-[acyl-carrier-protein] reductase [Candidatus Mcinerneyibacteriales bacterium]|nr:3-oxoacyl-[acyl-carrier-protein] reductase [Candidatus Mcinerneyibacteriales bacterium]